MSSQPDNGPKELVQQMLTFSRHHAPQRQPLRLHLLIHETLQLLRAALPSTIDIRAFLNTTSGTVLANPAQLQQVLMNLASNADYAMRTTGGVLEVHLDEVDSHPSRRGRLPAASARALPAPDDPGYGGWHDTRGYGADFRALLYDEGPGRRDRAGPGGRLWHHHQAWRDHHSRQYPWAGNDIYHLSASGRRGASGQGPPCRALLPTGTERILFVDDEEALRTLARETLVRLGYDVTVSTSSLDALAAFRATPLRL